MISILFLLHVTLLLWALSGSRLILCLKPVGIMWSPEQNDSLQVWSLLAVVKRNSLGRDTWELWCLGAAAQPGGGGSWKVPTSQARWSGMGQGFCGTFLYRDRMTTGLCEGLGSCCGAAPPRDASLPASCSVWNTEQSHWEELALQSLGQPTCCWSELHSVQSCIKRRIFFPCRTINPC